MDHCLDENGEIEEWAQRIIEEVDSYAEWSPSGTGVHIWVYGTVRGSTRPVVDGHKVEVYSEEKFITVTGDHLPGTPLEIVNVQDMLDEWAGRGEDKVSTGVLDLPPATGLSDEQVIAKASTADNGEKFRKLFFDGDVSTYHDGDDSRADLALVSLLGFYTGGDVDQIDRLFRRSGLYREKWEREDYRERTINKALGGKTADEIYTPKDGEISFPHSHSPNSVGTTGISNLKRNLEAVSFHGKKRPDPRSWVVNNLIPAGYPATLYGEGGNAKSILALQLGLSVAEPTIMEWLGNKVQTSPVLYLDFELDEEEQLQRAHDLAAGMRLTELPENFLYLSTLGFRTDEAFRAAVNTCVEHGVKLVIVDSIGPALQGDAESAKDVLGFFEKYIDPLKAAGAAVLMVDHQSKIIKGEKYANKQAFGSVYKTNLSRSVLQIQGAWDVSKSMLTATLRHQKTNFGPKLDNIIAELTFEEGRIDIERVVTPVGMLIEDAPKAKDKVLEALKAGGPMYPDAIAKATGQELKTVQNELSKLRRTGEIVDTGNKNGRTKEVRLASFPRSQPIKGMGMTGISETASEEEIPFETDALDEFDPYEEAS